MKYEINPKKIFNLVPIPCEIKEYINEVSGENLKILFLIFSEKKTLSCFEIATKLNINVSQVEDSINFWKLKGILNSPKECESIFEIEKPSAENISYEEIKTAKEENYLIAMLFKETEALYARPLRPIERRTLLYIYEFYKLSVDVILMVFEFGIRYKKSLKYILNICESVSEQGINSHEQIENYIKNLTEKYKIESQIKNCFGIYNRKLSTNEQKYINRWFHEYKFNIKIIKVAFDRCVDRIGSLSFQYMDKILQNWNKQNIKNLNDIEKIDDGRKITTKKQNKKTSYDLDDLLSKNSLFIPE